MTVGAHLRITASGMEQIGEGFKKIGRAIKSLGVDGKKMADVLGKDISGLMPKFGALSAMIGGIGLAGGAKKVMDFSRFLAQLKADAGYSEIEIRKLKTEIESLADSSGVLTSELGLAYKKFQDMGGQVELAREIMPDLALYSKATSSEMEEVATIAATLGKNLGMGKDEIIKTLSLVNELGKAGNLAAKEVAPNLPQLLGSGVSRGFKGEHGVGQLVAAHQIVSKSFGATMEGSNMARTALDALMRDLETRAKDLDKMGIKVFDKDKNMRDFDVLMAEILKKAGGDPLKLGKIFTADSRKAASAFMNVKDKSTIGEDVKQIFSVKATKQDLVTSFEKVTTGVGEAAHKYDLAASKMEAALQEHGAKLLGFVAEKPGTTAALGIGGYFGIKLAPLIGKSILKMFGNKTIGGKDIPSAVGNLLGVGEGQKVFITNWPESMGGKGVNFAGNPIDPIGETVKKAGLLKSAVGIIGAAGAGYAVGTALDQWLGISDYISNAGVGGKRDEAKKRGAEYEKEAQKQAIVEQAKTLANLANRGIGSVEVSGRGRTNLTAENILKIAEEKIAKQGLSSDESSLLLKQIVNLLREQKIVVQPSNGLDKADVKVSRGARR